MKDTARVSPDSVIVAGASGFIGRHLAAALRKQGHSVFSLTRDSIESRYDSSDPIWTARTIFYLANSMTPATAEQASRLAASDYEALERLLCVLGDSGTDSLFVLPSSGGTVYDSRSAPPYKEESRLGASSVYGSTKIMMEHLLLRNPGRLRPVILRLANVYGPVQSGRGDQGVIAHWLRAIAAGTAPRIYGNLDVCRDYIYVDDVVRAMILVLQHGRGLHDSSGIVVLNIGSGEPTSLRQLMEYISDVVGRVVSFDTRMSRSFDRGDVWLDVEKAIRMLGWEPSVGLHEGISRTWKNFDSDIGKNI